MLQRLTSVYVKLKRPLVAGLLAPPSVDETTDGGLLTYLEVIPAKKGLASTYFPKGFKMKGDVALAPMFFPKEVVDAVYKLRKRGTVVVVSECMYEKGRYVFKGLMLSFKTMYIGNLAWHEATGGYPPLMEFTSPLYYSPPLLATVESVISGTGLYAYSFELVPVKVKGEVKGGALALPLALMGIANWRRERLASRKEGEGGGEASGEG